MPPEPRRLSDDLERWRAGASDKTLGGLVETFDEKSFAVLFVVLMGVPALPVPTGGVTNVLEIIVMLLAVQLIAGRDHVWLPRRWRRLTLAGDRWQRFLARLTGLIRRLERLSRPRAAFLFGHGVTNRLFGVLVLIGAGFTSIAPPFTGLDTLPALGTLLLSLGVVLEDVVVVLVGLVIGAGGIALVLALGLAAYRGLQDLALVVSAAAPGAGTAAGSARSRCAGRPSSGRCASRSTPG